MELFRSGESATGNQARLLEVNAVEPLFPGAVYHIGLIDECMKKAKRTQKDELRRSYKRSDFAGPLVRGKYAKRYRKGTNLVLLKPEVAAAFPTERAVNDALTALIRGVRDQHRLARRSGRVKAGS